MSGGSYDYLCHVWDLDDLLSKREPLGRMAERLSRLGYAQDAAAETLNLIADLNAIEVRLGVTLKRLRPVWRAVEWWDSSDSGEDSLQDALALYRTAQLDPQFNGLNPIPGEGA